MKQGRTFTVSIRALLALAISVYMVALVVVHNFTDGPDRLVEASTVMWGLIYGAVLWSMLYLYKSGSRGIVLLFVLFGLCVYGQSLIYSQIFPRAGYYSSHVRLAAEHVHEAVKWVVIFTIAWALGLKFGEWLTPVAAPRTERWLASEANRRVLYIAAIVTALAYVVAAAILVPIHQKVWSDDFAIKLLLHPIVYHSAYVYACVTTLLDPLIRKSRRDRIWIAVFFFVYFFGQLMLGEKGAFMHLLVITFVCMLLRGTRRVSLKTMTVGVVAMLGLLVMFPLHGAVKGAVLALPEGPAAMVARFQEVWALNTDDFASVTQGGSQGNLLGMVESLSLRLGGVEWFGSVLARQDELAQYFTVPTFLKSVANTMIPVPGKPFGELVDAGRAMQMAIYGLQYEHTEFIGGYPMLPGWLYVTFSPVGGTLFLFAWGALVMWVLRSDFGMTTKLIFTYLFVWSFWLSGDLAVYIKDYFMFIGLLWVVRRMTRLGASRPLVVHPLHPATGDVRA